MFWDLAYALRATPWDTGEVPPEVLRAVGDGTVSAPGRALDVGCGTGTNVIYLAKHGLEVVGADVSRLAVRSARIRAREAGVDATLIAADVTELPLAGAPFAEPFDFILDIGCYHGLDERKRASYAKMVASSLGPHGHFLLYAHTAPGPSGLCPGPSPAGQRGRLKVTILRRLLGRRRPAPLPRESIEKSFGSFCRLVRSDDGTDAGRRSTWFLWQRRRHETEA